MKNNEPPTYYNFTLPIFINSTYQDLCQAVPLIILVIVTSFRGIQNTKLKLGGSVNRNNQTNAELMHSSSTWHFYHPKREEFWHQRRRKRHRYKPKKLAMTANSPFLFPIPGVRSGGIRYSAIAEVGKGLPQKERGGYFKLAKGWIAVKSSFKLGRVFYYNVEKSIILTLETDQPSIPINLL